MDEVAMRLSAFGDEISDQLEVQLGTLRALKICALELRGAWGKNVLHLNHDEASEIARACSKHQITISGIGSPIGKAPISRPIGEELADLKHIFAIAETVKTRIIRVFSYYPPEPGEGTWSEDDLVGESIARLTILTESAAAAGMTLVLENEQGIVGDSISRCARLLNGIVSSQLNFAWDPGNFAGVGELSAVADGWQTLGPRIRLVHIKDYRHATKESVPAGEGDGQIDHLLTKLATVNYDGFLALEPHLVQGGRMGGFSGVDGMTRAANALRSLMARLEIAEQVPEWASGEHS